MKSNLLFKLSVIVGLLLLVTGILLVGSKQAETLGCILLFPSFLFFSSGAWGLWFSEKNKN